jgi:hypothetical protein
MLSVQIEKLFDYCNSSANVKSVFFFCLLLINNDVINEKTSCKNKRSTKTNCL